MSCGAVNPSNCSVYNLRSAAASFVAKTTNGAAP